MDLKLRLEAERKAFQDELNLDKIDSEWDNDGYYDSDVGQDVILLWNGWLARADLGLSTEELVKELIS